MLDSFDESIIRSPPYVIVEDLHFDRSAVACGVYCLTQAPQLDDAVAHHGAAHQDAWQGYRPIGHVEADNLAARAGNLVHDFGSHQTWKASITTPAAGLES